MQWFLDWIRTTQGMIAAAVGVIAVVLLVWVFSGWVSVHNNAVTKQNDLNATYVDNQNALSTCVTSSIDQLNIAKVKTDKLQTIMVEAVKGRYDRGANSAVVQGEGKMFSALVEAYPNLEGTGIYDKVLTYVQGCREDFKNAQSKLLSQINNFDSFRQKFPNSIFAGGYPNRNLKANNGTDTVYADAALERMNDIIISQKAADAYRTGRLEQLPIPGSE